MVSTTIKILIVDDKPAIIEMSKLNLEAHEYQVISASDGQEALSKIRDERPDLIITDVVMPGMDGFAFFKELKKDDALAKIPVMVLTARPAMEDTFRVFGVNEFLVKPIEPKILIMKIEESLHPKVTESKFGKMLIIGNDYIVIDAVVNQIQDNFEKIAVSTEGKEACESIALHKPDYVLIETMLWSQPSLDTVELIRSVNDNQSVPILMFTQLTPDDLKTSELAKKLKEAKTDCLKAGANKFIGFFTRVVIMENIENIS